MPFPGGTEGCTVRGEWEEGKSSSPPHPQSQQVALRSSLGNLGLGARPEETGESQTTDREEPLADTAPQPRVSGVEPMVKDGCTGSCGLRVLLAGQQEIISS